MRKRLGYTRKVLEAQIVKYEEILSDGLDKQLKNWLYISFGSTDNCPVCLYRFHGGFVCKNEPSQKDCLALVNGVDCMGQDWFGRLLTMRRDDKFNAIQVRKTLKTRLKYWQAIYKEKYPEGL